MCIKFCYSEQKSLKDKLFGSADTITLYKLFSYDTKYKVLEPLFHDYEYELGGNYAKICPTSLSSWINGVWNGGFYCFENIRDALTIINHTGCKTSHSSLVILPVQCRSTDFLCRGSWKWRCDEYVSCSVFGRIFIDPEIYQQLKTIGNRNSCRFIESNGTIISLEEYIERSLASFIKN